MKIVYMGTPQFAAAPLRALYEAGHEIVCTVTQPDKPNSRRGKEVIFSAVKRIALELGIQVFQPQRASSAESVETIRSLEPDIIVVCAFGQILSRRLIESAKFGAVNIHASLLPKYRGAAPIHRAILDGETQSGISVIQLDEGLDTGDVMLTEKTEITPEMTASRLHKILSELGAKAIVNALELIEKNEAVRIAQNESAATYAHKIEKHERLVDFNLPAAGVLNKIRGLDEFPGAYAVLDEKRVQLFGASLLRKQDNALPGKIAGSKDDLLLVEASGGLLAIAQVKPEGKKRMSGREFYLGLKSKDSVFNANEEV